MAFAMTPEPTADTVPGPLRTCIVTGAEASPERMFRFVVGPENEVVPDLARRLPGRRAAVPRAIAVNRHVSLLASC